MFQRVSFRCSSSEYAKRTDALKRTAVAQQRRVEIHHYAVGVQPCDTSRLALRLRTVQENAGYTLNMAMTGSLKLHQAAVHHGMTDEVVVAGALNSERSIARCVMRTSGSDAATARVHMDNAADSYHLCIAPPQRLTIQNFPNCPTHSKVSVWDNTPWATRRDCNVAVPNPPPDVLVDRPRAHQYTPTQPTSCRGGLGTATLQPPPASSTPISASDFRKFKSTTHKKFRECVVSHTLVLRGKRYARVKVLFVIVLNTKQNFLTRNANLGTALKELPCSPHKASP